MHEEILGAGMAVRYDENGVGEFVFLDEEDKIYRVLTSTLDEGWREKLLKLLTPMRHRIIVLSDGETWERICTLDPFDSTMKQSSDVFVVDVTDEEMKRIEDGHRPGKVVDLTKRGRRVV